ncbi:MAG: KH domain-containing protein [Bacilli bacterium]|nr:KH domain-containing protein [Bacilli bacterium]MBR2997552.1 KH domain-containing protein [Bacilli bacterium]
MSLVELTEFIVKSLVTDEDSVSVKEFETDDNEITIEIVVSESEAGSLIGKGGKTINSIRTILQASSYLKENKKVKVNISTF